MKLIVLIGCVVAALFGGALLLRPPGADGPIGADGTISGDVVIFHAGSLSVPFRRVSELFERKFPNVTVKAEAAGTRDCAQKLRSLGRRCDVFGAADYKVVENLLMPEYVDFNISFATNEMVIAYTDQSGMCGNITSANWYDILLQNGVVFGRSDPDRDPCGYRTVMVFQLAEKHYNAPGLAKRLAQKHGRRFMRPKETDLMALLEAGEIDYVFIYRSVARQHGLRVLRLPDEVNLGSPALADLYSMATVKVTGKAPGEFITRRGAPVVYSVTIPMNAPNREAAEAYVALLLSEEGRAAMEESGQPVITPARAAEPEKVPARLRPFCR